jgi:ketosteroid isomerase-like protein
MAGAIPAGQITGTGNIATIYSFYDLLGHKELKGWARLWQEDGKIVVPYPPQGFPSVIDGKQDITTGFNALFGNFRTFHAAITAVYPAADSDAVVVEYRNDAILNNGTRYTNDNIAVFQFTDGLISEYHDYFDPRRFQAVVDALPAD